MFSWDDELNPEYHQDVFLLGIPGFPFRVKKNYPRVGEHRLLYTHTDDAYISVEVYNRSGELEFVGREIVGSNHCHTRWVESIGFPAGGTVSIRVKTRDYDQSFTLTVIFGSTMLFLDKAKDEQK